MFDREDYDDGGNVDVMFQKAVLAKRFERAESLFDLISTCVRHQYITGAEFHKLHSAWSPEIVRYYVSAGVDVNIKNPETDETPLFTVIKLNKSPDVVRELLKHGASVEARNKHTMNTALNQAVHMKQCPPEIILTLLEYGAATDTANKYDDTPLHRACECFRGDLTVVEALLKYGCPVNFKNFRGDTPLNASLQNEFCNPELVRILLKLNAKVNVKAFQDAIQLQLGDYLDILSELLQHASITSGEDWSSILRHLLNCTAKEQKLADCGKLLIKHAFLQCDNPCEPIVCCFRRFKGLPFFSLPLIFNFNGTEIMSAAPLQRKSGLESVRNNLKSFTEDCYSQIERMKTDLLESIHTTVYQFVVSKSGKVGLDSKILKILKENTYPIYCDIILNKIKRSALLDKMVLQQVYTVVQRGEVAQRITLDVLSVGNIGKYLNEDEIRNLIEAFFDPSNDEYCFLDNLEEIEAHLSTKPRFTTKKKLASPTGHSSSKVQKKSSTRI